MSVAEMFFNICYIFIMIAVGVTFVKSLIDLIR